MLQINTNVDDAQKYNIDESQVHFNYEMIRRNNITHNHDNALFLARELEYIVPRSFDVLQAPLKATTLLPVSSDVPAASKSFVYKSFKEYSTGARAIANYADDLPRVEIDATSVTGYTNEYGLSYDISIQDLRIAAANGLALEQRKANAVTRGMAQKLNTMAFYGDAPNRITGWFTAAGINAAPVAGANVGAKLWANKTADLILKDLNEPLIYVKDNTNGVEIPNTIVLPLAQYSLIKTMPRAAGTDTTILEFFLATNPGVSVEEAAELKGAFAGDTDGMIVYVKSEDKACLEMPMAPVRYAPQWTNLAYVVNYSMIFGGFVLRYPKSQCFRYGI